MAHEFQLSDGTTTIDLVYAASLQEDYRLLADPRIGVSQPRVVVHEPDAGEALPARLSYRDRRMLFYFQSLGDDWDEICGQLNAIQRLLNQATRYWTDGDVPRVDLRVKLDGATRAVHFPVKYGTLDTSHVLNTTNLLSTLAHKLALELVTSPFGEAPSEDLHNSLINPGFEEWHAGTADAQPDGWDDYENLTSGSGSNNRTTSCRQGSYALRIAASNLAYGEYKGVQQTLSDVVESGSGYMIVWVNVSDLSGSGQVVIQHLRAGGGSDTEYIAAATGGWQKIVVPCYGIDAGGTVRVYIECTGAGGLASATVYVDQMLLMAADDEPQIWMSSSFVRSHWDGDVGHIDYIDITDIPGDADALLDIRIKRSTATLDGEVFYIARRSVDTPTAMDHIFEGEDFNQGMHYVTDETDADASNGAAIRTNPSPPELLGYAFCSRLLEHNRGRFRVFGRCKADSTAVQFRVTLLSSLWHAAAIYGQSVVSDWISPPVANKYVLLDFGVLELPPKAEWLDALGWGDSGGIKLEIQLDDAAHAGWVDYLAFFPVDEDQFGILRAPGGDYLMEDEWELFVELRSTDIQASLIQDYSGMKYFMAQWDTIFPGLITARPGAENRFFIMSLENDGADTVSIVHEDTEPVYTVQLRITPRTMHFLGAP